MLSYKKYFRFLENELSIPDLKNYEQHCGHSLHLSSIFMMDISSMKISKPMEISDLPLGIETYTYVEKCYFYLAAHFLVVHATEENSYLYDMKVRCGLAVSGAFFKTSSGENSSSILPQSTRIGAENDFSKTPYGRMYLSLFSFTNIPTL